MTDGFLHDVARYFADGHPGMPPHQDIVYVLPNKRGALFLKEHIHRTMTCPGRMPRLTTMRAFLNGLAGFPEASERAQIFMLYDAYRRVAARRGALDSVRPFDSFVFWADMIVNDFDEIDRSLVSADDIFRNLKQVKEIQADYLDADQKEVVRRIWGESRLTGHTERFWLHVGNDENEDSLARKFVYLWEILAEIYHEYKAILRSKGMISTGDSYRMAVEAVRALDPSNLPPHTHYAFVGFNDAGTAETLIFQRLKDLGIASFLWDTAALNLFGEAAGQPLRRLRQLVKAFPPPQGFETHGHDASQIAVDVYSVPSQMAQAKQTGHTLSRWVKEGCTNPDNPIDTALVLPDQSMLLPVMFSIPEDIRRLNVSMGLPYRSTTFAALLQNIVSMQLRARKIRGEYHFFFEDLSAVLSHPHMRYIDSAAADTVIAEIKKKKLYNVNAAELAERYPVFKAVFTPVHNLKDVDEVAEYLIQLFHWLSSSLSDADTAAMMARGDEPAHEKTVEKFEHKVLDYLARSVEALAELAKEYGIDMEDRTFLRLFERMLNHSEVPASGTPLAGLQILGVLETRTLDFDNVAVLSMNEKIFPRRQYTHTMIPGALRAGYGLPDLNSLESTYAYCFFRLVARARRIALCFDSRSNKEGAAEMSRYISQLMYLVPGLDVKIHNVDLGGVAGSGQDIAVHKTSGVMKNVNRLRAGGDLWLSASALKEYKHCPLAFYLKYVRGLRDGDEVVDYLNNADHGTIVHSVIQRAFATFGKRPVTDAALTKLVDPSNPLLAKLALDEVVNHKYRQYASNPDELPAEGRLAADIIAVIARSDIEAERRAYCADGRCFIFSGAEVVVKKPWKIAPDLSVNWKMSIDRKDDLPDGSYRFVDFKTGRDKVSVSSLENLTRYNSDTEGIFQLLTYCEAYRAVEQPGARITPVIHLTRALSRSLGIEPITIGKEPVLEYTPELADRFRPALHNLIASIFDPSVPFTQCESAADCTFCPFKDTCGR